MALSKDCIRRFTLSEFESRLPASPANKNHSAMRVYDDSSTEHGAEWYGVPSVGDVVKITEGARSWDGVEKAKRDVQEIELPVCRSLRRVRRFGEEGDEARVDVLLSGQMDIAMESRRRDVALGGSPVFRVWCQFGNHCNIDADQFLWRAAALVRFCEAVEAAGGSVEIVGFHYGKKVLRDGGDAIEIITVKAAGEDVSLRKLAVIFGLSGWSRVYGFAALLALPHAVSGNLGYPQDEPPAGFMEPGDYLLGGVRSRDAAVAWLKDTVGKIQAGVSEG